MDTAELENWIQQACPGIVEKHSDRALSLPKNLLRFYCNGQPSVAVGSDAKDKLRINSVLNGIQWYLRRPGTVAGTLNIIIGCGPKENTASMKEHLGAMSTLILGVNGDPLIQLWSIESGREPTPVIPETTAFSAHLGGKRAARWNAMLMAVVHDSVDGMALELVNGVRDDRLRLYPKLSNNSANRRWQVRLDGAEIGYVGDDDFEFRINTKVRNIGEQPLKGWIDSGLPIDLRSGAPVGRIYNRLEAENAIDDVEKLIRVWGGDSGTSLLDNRQPEHRLESRVLSGQIRLRADGADLEPVIPSLDGSLRTAQFPTLWGDVDHTRRYLDALLRGGESQPWAIEIKDHNTGGHGQYLRDGIAQAVLYRHFIRSAAELDPWFDELHLQRDRCRAGLAFPSALPGTDGAMSDLKRIAKLVDVEVIEFEMPRGMKLDGD